MELILQFCTSFATSVIKIHNISPVFGALLVSTPVPVCANLLYCFKSKDPLKHHTCSGITLIQMHHNVKQMNGARRDCINYISKKLEGSVSLAVRESCHLSHFQVLIFWGSNLELILFCDVSQNN